MKISIGVTQNSKVKKTSKNYCRSFILEFDEFTELCTEAMKKQVQKCFYIVRFIKEDGKCSLGEEKNPAMFGECTGETNPFQKCP